MFWVEFIRIIVYIVKMVARRPHGEFEGYLIRMVERKPYGEDCKQVMGHGEVMYI